MTPTSANSKSLYLLLGMAGALVGADISEALFHFDVVHALIGAGLGAAFFVIGWRQLQPP
jgi:uncharacterized membrane protein YeaQ/YmgE (transglycosylase-associated protein family)